MSISKLRFASKYQRSTLSRQNLVNSKIIIKKLKDHFRRLPLPDDKKKLPLLGTLIELWAPSNKTRHKFQVCRNTCWCKIGRCLQHVFRAKKKKTELWYLISSSQVRHEMREEINAWVGKKWQMQATRTPKKISRIETRKHLVLYVVN